MNHRPLLVLADLHHDGLTTLYRPDLAGVAEDPETSTTAVVHGILTFDRGLRAVGFVYRPDAPTTAYVLRRSYDRPDHRNVEHLAADLAHDLARDPETDGWRPVPAVTTTP